MNNVRIVPILGSLLLVFWTLIVHTFMPVSDSTLKMMGLIGIIQLIFSIISWWKQTGDALTPYVIFLIAAYIFTFGQSLLYVFDIVSTHWNLLSFCSPSRVYDAQKVTLIFLNFFHIGGLLSCSQNSQTISCVVKNTDSELIYLENQICGIKLVGKIFLIISVIPFIIETVTIFHIAATLGYGGLYIQEAKIGIFNIINILSQYFLPGLLCLLVVEGSKIKRNIYIVIFILDVAFWMFVGGRSNGVIIAAILLMYFHICVRKIKFKQAAIVIVIGFFFISLLSAVSDTRSNTKASFVTSFVENFGKADPFYDAISEMGGSMFPLIKTMTIVPEQQDYRYGSSYLWASTSVIPNLGFWDLHPAMKYANLNDWLQKTLRLNYGPGFSIIAEAYINFGDYGCLMMLLLGYIFGLIFNIDLENKYSPLKLIMSLLFCYLIIKTVRNSFLATVRSLFYYILPIYLIVRYKGGKFI